MDIVAYIDFSPRKAYRLTVFSRLLHRCIRTHSYLNYRIYMASVVLLDRHNQASLYLFLTMVFKVEIVKMIEKLA
jgi:hypothetical protein